MSAPETIYVTYIAAPPEKIWAALTQGDFTRQYFFGMRLASDWKTGSAFKLVRPDGVVDVTGRVLESDPPRFVSFTWHLEQGKASKLPASIISYRLEELGGVVRLTMTEAHPDLPDLRLLEGGRRGWPAILSGLKTLVETGKPLPAFDMSYQREGGAMMQRVVEELKL